MRKVINKKHLSSASFVRHRALLEFIILTMTASYSIQFWGSTSWYSHHHMARLMWGFYVGCHRFAADGNNVAHLCCKVHLLPYGFPAVMFSESCESHLNKFLCVFSAVDLWTLTRVGASKLFTVILGFFEIFWNILFILFTAKGL